MKSLFDPAVNKIVQLVESQVAQARNDKRRVINVRTLYRLLRLRSANVGRSE